MEAKIWNKNFWIEEIEPKELKKNYKIILLKSNFTILNFIDYHFKPFGYSCLWLLAESHLAIHTFPEENKSYIELSSCNEEKFKKFIQIIKKQYKINNIHEKKLNEGNENN